MNPLLTHLDTIEAFLLRMRLGPDAAYLSASDVLALFRAIGATRVMREALEEVSDIQVGVEWPVAVEFRA